MTQTLVPSRRPVKAATANALLEPAWQAPSQPPLLSVRDLSKQYSGQAKPVFTGVSFDLHPGDAVAIIGANGTGKSTLLRSCLRLQEPNSGELIFRQQALHDMGSRQLRRARHGTGMVFQKHCLAPRLTVLSNVIHGCLGVRSGPRYWLHSFAPSDIRAKAMHCLEQVGLAHLALQRCEQLSGGQSQRVAIARALMQDPDLLLADEPTASLDPQSAEDVMQLFQKLNQQGLTLLFVSHQIEHALQYANRVLGLKDQQLMLDSPSARLSYDELREFYV